MASRRADCHPWIESDPTWQPYRTDPKFRSALASAEASHKAFGRRFGLAK